jgi:hypothetical protein
MKIGNRNSTSIFTQSIITKKDQSPINNHSDINVIVD